jgi:hypothetical protein
MPENQTKRTFDAQTSLKSSLRLEPSAAAPMEKITPQQYARMSTKQREELVSRLIDFLKSF